MSFFRHEEIYRSDVSPGYSWERQLNVAAPVLIGCDEFPVGYSLAGCPPAEPASASPTGDDSQQSTLPYNDFSANGNYPLNFVSQSKGALHFCRRCTPTPLEFDHVFNPPVRSKISTQPSALEFPLDTCNRSRVG
jgi:hypothetical protein